MPIGGASRGPTTSRIFALRVDTKGKLRCVYSKYVMPSRKPKYHSCLKGVVDAEGSLLSPAVRRPLGDVHGLAGSPSIHK